MPLQDKLDAFKAEFAGKRPPEVLAATGKATADLIDSGQAERALKVGDRASEFTLSAPDGRMVSSRELLAQNPPVVTFYRGV